MNDETVMRAAAEAKAAQFFEDFKNYGLLLNTMSSHELATQIGIHFQSPNQCAILTTLMARLIAIEEKLGAEE